MSAKVHLLSCSEPHQDGSTVRVACGIELPNARSVAWVDDSILGTPAISLSVLVGLYCGKCWEYSKLERYTYLLVSGEESKQMERK